MLGAERGLPYDRPPPSKEFLRGEMTLAATRIHDENFRSFFREQGVELALGAPARHLRTGARAVELEVPVIRKLVAQQARVDERRITDESAVLALPAPT